MEYNSTEIVQLTNPYKVLGKEDLAPYQCVFDSLSTEEKKALALKMVSACPEDELAAFKSKINTLNTLPAEEKSFYVLLQDAHQVRSIIKEALDSKNKTPHKFLLEEFNPDLLNHFSEYALNCISYNTTSLAEQMALSIPETEYSKVTRNVNIVFPDSELAAKINQAFTLRRQIKTLLLGDHPEQFFISRDFNPGLYPPYSNLFNLNEKQIKAIGLKLSQLSDVKTHKKVIECIAQLYTEGHDEVNPFKRIADVMERHRKANQISVSSNPHTFLCNAKQPEQPNNAEKRNDSLCTNS